jgi:hypothetical protein
MPEETLVVGADDEVIAARVHVEGGDPAGTRLKRLDELLLGQIVCADVALCRHEKGWTEWVEFHPLDYAFGLAKRRLRVVLREFVDCYGAVLACDALGRGICCVMIYTYLLVRR